MDTWFRRVEGELVDGKKSMVCEAYGHPLVLRESERRGLEKGEVRIKTAFAGINYAGRNGECVTVRLVGV